MALVEARRQRAPVDLGDGRILSYGERALVDLDDPTVGTEVLSGHLLVVDGSPLPEGPAVAQPVRATHQPLLGYVPIGRGPASPPEWGPLDLSGVDLAFDVAPLTDLLAHEAAVDGTHGIPADLDIGKALRRAADGWEGFDAPDQAALDAVADYADTHLRGKDIPVPTAAEDGMGWRYDHAAGAFVWQTNASQAALDAHTAQTTGAHGGIVSPSDARLSDARTPLTHAASHAPGGTDALAVDQTANVGSLRTLGANPTQAAPGSDARFPTAAEKAALAGTGTPSGSNKYATADHAGLTGKIADPGGADWAILRRSGSTWAALAKGATSQHLIVRSDGTVAWVDPPEVWAVAWGVLTGAGQASQTTNLQAAVTALVGLGGGTLKLPVGVIIHNGSLVIGPDTPVRLLGSGLAMNPFGGGYIGGTMLRRTSGTNTAVDVQGRTAGTQAFVAIENLTIDGGGLAGMGIFLDRCNNSYLHRVFVNNCRHHGLRLRQVFNSSMDNIFVGSCGNGATPAVLFDSYPTGQGACATVHCSNIEIEASEGLALKLDGDTASQSACANVDFANLKIEASNPAASAYPDIHLAYAQSCHFTNTHLNCPRKTVPPILQDHPFGNPSGCTFSGTVEISGQNPGYAYRNVRGAMQFESMYVATDQALTAAVRIESTTAVNAVKGLGAVRTNIGAVVSDARATVDTTTIYGDAIIGRNLTVAGTVAYVGAGGTLQSPGGGRFVGYDNYNEALNAPKDASKPIWAWDLDSTADVFRVHRAPAGGVAFAVRFELPPAPTTLPAAASDLPTAITLLNAIRAQLIALKLSA